MGILELLVLFGVGAITLMSFGVISTVAMALAGVALAPSRSSCFLGVCARLARSLDVPVRGVRFLVALITLLIPGAGPPPTRMASFPLSGMLHSEMIFANRQCTRDARSAFRL